MTKRKKEKEKERGIPLSFAPQLSAEENRKRWERLKAEYDREKEARKGRSPAELSYDPVTDTIDPFGHLEEDED